MIQPLLASSSSVDSCTSKLSLLFLPCPRCSSRCVRNEPSKSVKIQTWNAECIHNFQTELNNANIYELLDTTLAADPTKYLNILNNVISQAKNKHLPYCRVKFNKHKHNNSKWITKGTVRSISYRDKLYLKLKRTPVDSERHNILKYNLKTYQSILKRLIRDANKF